MSEGFTSQGTSSGVTSHRFQNPDTATIPFSQFNRTQWNIPTCHPLTDYINQIESSQTRSNQPIRSNYHLLLVNTRTLTVPTLS